MSRENVKTVQAALAAWNAGDMEAVRAMVDPDATLRPPRGWPEPGPYVGREAVMREWAQVRDTWNADTVEPVSDFIDAADQVVVRVIWRTTGHGPEPRIELTIDYTMRNGRIFLIEYFWDHGEALATAGLSAGSPQNVDIVRRFFDALERSLEAWDGSRSLADAVRSGILPPESRTVFEYLSPDLEWHPIFSSETYRGFVEIARGWDDLLEAAVDYHLELLDATDLGNDRVLARFAPSLEGRSSGIHVDAAVFSVVTLENRLIMRVDEYTDRQEAFRAAGLGET
jgi:ketosteroid isomerase-like protein